MSQRFLAFDLGAQSGRALLAEYTGSALALREVARFPNEPVRANGVLQWDILRLWLQMTRAIDAIDTEALTSIGVDTWGVDFALLDDTGSLLENPRHYRDARHEGAMDAVCRRYGRERLYDDTGCQLLPINTLFQLYAACEKSPRMVAAARSLVTVPDLLNYWLTGTLHTEYTIASTTQMVDARTRAWNRPLLHTLGLPESLLLPILEPGTVLGELKKDVNARLAGTKVTAPACHDTGSAFASVSAPNGVYLSSGTWSLLGAELPAPVISPQAYALNFTNEGGVCGTTRLLKNIAGMWLLQECRRAWTTPAGAPDYDQLLASAAGVGLEFQSLFDPDDEAFFHPDDMPAAIGEYCRRTGQPAPDTPARTTRAILESLAFKYRYALESLETLTGNRYTQIRIVGGGSRNRLLNQFTADATDRVVVAGPAEATALGNIAMQMLASGTVDSLARARDVIDSSFPVERFEPTRAREWDRQYARFRDYVDAGRR